MPEDFPAAHSMDTTWFAVDAVGHVGVFETGEDGIVPEGALTGTGYRLGQFLEQIPLVEEPPVRKRGQRANPYDHHICRGMYVYSYGGGEDLWWPYDRERVPTTPIHLEELPPAARKLFTEVRFLKVNFAECAVLQIAEHASCRGHIDFNIPEPTSYLASDGKTLCPIPIVEFDPNAFAMMFEAQRESPTILPLIEPPTPKPKKKKPVAKKKPTAPPKPKKKRGQ